jgi:hypothetical protein
MTDTILIGVTTDNREYKGLCGICGNHFEDTNPAILTEQARGLEASHYVCSECIACAPEQAAQRAKRYALKLRAHADYLESTLSPKIAAIDPGDWKTAQDDYLSDGA